MCACVIMPKTCTRKKRKASISYPLISQKYVVSNKCHSKAEFYNLTVARFYMQSLI